MTTDQRPGPELSHNAKTVLVAGSGCLLLFLVLAAIVWRADGALPPDLAISGAIAGLREPLLDQVMINASYLCVWQVLVAGGVAASVWMLAWRRWLPMVLMWLSLLGNSLLIEGIKSAIARPRPDQALALLPATGYSFPSGHTFSSVAFYGVLGLMALITLRSGPRRTAVAVAMVAVSGLVGVSRVYVGAHWPTDVLGSWLLGGTWLALMAALIARFGHRGAPTPLPAAALRWGVAVFCLWVVAIVALAVLDPAVRMSGSVGETPAQNAAYAIPLMPATG